MFKQLMTWFWGRVSVRHRIFQRAQGIYDRYAAEIELGLLGPTVDQREAARHESALDEVERLYLEVVELCRASGDEHNLAIVLFQLGLLERLRGRFDRAIHRFEQALTILDGLVAARPYARSSVSLCHFYLGQAYLEEGKHREARRHLETAIDIDQVMRDMRRLEAAKSLMKQCDKC